MRLFSHDFFDNQKMDSKFTCDGEGLSPHLAWDDFPSATKSFAVSCFDPDSPSGDFCHWLMINLPREVTEIVSGDETAAGAKVLANTGGQNGYYPPCPPSGTHRYVFTVYALDCLTLEAVERENFIEKVTEHKIDSAQIIGLFQRL
jgi:hypothetical protein